MFVIDRKNLEADARENDSEDTDDMSGLCLLEFEKLKYFKKYSKIIKLKSAKLVCQ